MSDVILSVENLCKRYLLPHKSEAKRREPYLLLSEVSRRKIRNIGRKTVGVLRGMPILEGDEIEEFWALRNVTFEMKRGEVLGIIGRNGAGKSTLLKILSRVTEPTRGRVVLGGRVASLLEVGTGFHPELTGRENILLNGAILGMRRYEILRKFDEIVAFAEVEKFLELPVKHYSSGMYIRLAFAVAAHLESEILIIDEALSVGDAEFQQKCLGKMNDASRCEGRTVLMVSHDLATINKLCPKTIWLDRGSIRAFGVTEKLIQGYLGQPTVSFDHTVQLNHLPRQWVKGNELRLKSLQWLCDLPLKHGEPVQVRISLETHFPVFNVSVAIGFSGLGGNRILTYDTDLQNSYRPNISHPGVYFVHIEIDAFPLQPDVYLLDLSCRSGELNLLDYISSALQLEVVSGPRTPGFFAQRLSGVRLESRATWEFDRNLERLGREPIGSKFQTGVL
jgi:lipopolysaccharide transport system ATP-binding protein